MCQTQAAVDKPLTTIDPTQNINADATAPGGMPTTNTQVSVPVMHRTKFGHLMDFAGPALLGGLVGGTVGATTGHGGQAAQDFFDKQRMFQLQKAQLQRQQEATDAQIDLERARTSREINRPDFTRGEPIPDDQGGFSARDPRDGTYKHVPGSEQKTPPDSFAPVVTDQGVMTMNHRDGSMAPATVPNPAAAPQTMQVPVHSNDPNNPGPSLPQQVTPNVPANIPLQPATKERNETPFGVWRQQNPDKPVKDYLRIGPDVRAADRAPKSDSHLTANQKVNLTKNYKAALAAIEKERVARQSGTYIDPKTQQPLDPMSEDELTERKQQAEDAYKDELEVGGEQDVSRFDYASQVPTGPPGSSTKQSGQSDSAHKVGDVVTYQGKQYKISGIKGGKAELVPAH